MLCLGNLLPVITGCLSESGKLSLWDSLTGVGGFKKQFCDTRSHLVRVCRDFLLRDFCRGLNGKKFDFLISCQVAHCHILWSCSVFVEVCV